MNLQDMMLSEITKSQKGTNLYKTPRVVKIIETESRMVVARGWQGEGNRKLLFSEYRVLVL